MSRGTSRRGQYGSGATSPGGVEVVVVGGRAGAAAAPAARPGRAAGRARLPQLVLDLPVDLRQHHQDAGGLARGRAPCARPGTAPPRCPTARAGWRRSCRSPRRARGRRRGRRGLGGPAQRRAARAGAGRSGRRSAGDHREQPARGRSSSPSARVRAHARIARMRCLICSRLAARSAPGPRAGRGRRADAAEQARSRAGGAAVSCRAPVLVEPAVERVDVGGRAGGRPSRGRGRATGRGRRRRRRSRPRRGRRGASARARSSIGRTAAQRVGDVAVPVDVERRRQPGRARRRRARRGRPARRRSPARRRTAAPARRPGAGAGRDRAVARPGRPARRRRTGPRPRPAQSRSRRRRRPAAPRPGGRCSHARSRRQREAAARSTASAICRPSAAGGSGWRQRAQLVEQLARGRRLGRRRRVLGARGLGRRALAVVERAGSCGPRRDQLLGRTSFIRSPRARRRAARAAA